MNTFLNFNWASGCPNLNEWFELDDSFPEHITGTYTFTDCAPGGPIPGLPEFTVTWDFIQQD
ncbi:MAG: hypothetical protein ACOX3E_00610 [Desulfomonilia bacterium]|jgi:hypothetical protein|uniref:Uncharacterized protein n=1 Tax=anaerobic digester metagenome TaxID=1263854 RepID=A0A485M5N7_9ZZZZ|nr:hypothetical protein [Pseudomonadota bacterium]HPD22680.1 hypothetical protein [Deltaproteobacteria bacterium]